MLMLTMILLSSCGHHHYSYELFQFAADTKRRKSFADTIRKRKEEKRLQLLRRSFLLVWFWCITGIIAFLAYWNKLRNYLCWFLKYRYIFWSSIWISLKIRKILFAILFTYQNKSFKPSYKKHNNYVQIIILIMSFYFLKFSFLLEITFFS